MFRLFILLSLAGLSAALPTQAQTTRFVSTTGTNSNPASATSWATSTTNLQGAINASGVTQVWIAAGVYKPTSTTARDVSFSMKNGVAIYGGFVGNETLLSQRPAINPVSGNPNAARPSSTTLSGDIGTPGSTTDNSYHVIFNDGLNSSAILDGVVITAGNANVSGNNSGGAIYNNTSSPTLTNCSLQSNQANFGGAILNFVGSNPMLTNCSLQSNRANSNGGAILNFDDCNPVLINCSLQNNQANDYGGAISNTTTSSPILINCSLQNNQANNGGVSFNNNGSITTLTNCVVFNNGAGNTFYNPSGSVSATYSLFDNTVTGYSSSPTNLTTTPSPFISANSVELAPGSPAINAGLNSANTTLTDLAGLPRIVNNTIDMGAVEFQVAPAITGQPASASTVCAGASVEVPVSVSGSVSGYQWLKGGSPVANQTSATLSLGNIQGSDAGVYSLSVSGPLGNSTSNGFTLTVNTLPIATITFPNSVTVQGTGVPIVRVPSLNPPVVFQASGGTIYERMIIVDRINGYEIRQNDSNNTGIFPITRLGLFTLTVKGAGGCSRTVQWVVEQQ